MAAPAGPSTSTKSPTTSFDGAGSRIADFDWGFEEDDEGSKTDFILQCIVAPMRSAFILDLVTDGLPKQQTGIFYLLFIHLHEELYRPLYVYSAVPAFLMWCYPDLHPLFGPHTVYAITQLIDYHKGERHRRWKRLLTSHLSSLAYVCFFRCDCRGVTELLEPIFGPASTWPAVLLPIVPGMFLRSVDERPNSINGFVPEGREGIGMALFIRACTAVLPSPIQWLLWAAYASPSTEYPTMFVDWLFCTFSWVLTDTSIIAAYAMWLLVNQYRHAKTWLRNFGGGPSIVLERERRGLLWYVATIIVVLILEYEAGPFIMENELLTFPPQTWMPLVLILVVGLYLLKYGLMLRVYKFKHDPLRKGENFRLLRLRAQPCLPNAPIQCDIIHSSLQRPPQYVAVSHRWESSDAPQEMILINGGLFPVSRSIYSLLSAKRSNLHPRYLWIDSVCINQTDAIEKSKQVSIMRNIFEEAELVLAWLGNDPGATKALSLARRICKIRTSRGFAVLREELDAGWEEFERLVSNEFFERAWVIQEICVGKEQVIRYGNQEMKWELLVKALKLFMSFSPRGGKNSSRLIHQQEIVNAIVIDEMRSRVAGVDLIKLKDALKLGLGFKATLPVDKVYALLGLVDERYTPLLHPKSGISDASGNEVRKLKVLNTFKDFIGVWMLLSGLLSTASGTRNTRRGKAILSSTTENAAVRHMKCLVRDASNLSETLERLMNEREGTEEDLTRPDYSEKSTVQLVYTHVARDLIKQHDALSVVRFAGLRHRRRQGLAGLPSWVPDWSGELDTYILPWCHYSEIDNVSRERAETSAGNKDFVFQDGGSNFLFTKGHMIGIVAHSTPLTQPFNVGAQGSQQEEIKEDFSQIQTGIGRAWQLAQQHSKPLQPDPVLRKAFCKTLAADSNASGKFDTALLCLWDSTSMLSRCVAASLWPEKHRDFWDAAPNSCDPEWFGCGQNEILALYAFVRATQSSTNSKFAHLTRTDIIPSFTQYRSKDKDINPSEVSGSSFLDTGPANTLNFYAPYTDFTINRSFVVTNSGLMGLAPADSRVGDHIFELQTQGRVMWLVLREKKYPEPEPEPKPEFKGRSELGAASASTSSAAFDVESPVDTESSLPSEKQSPPHHGTYRLVGEAFINKSNDRPSQVGEPQWLRLW